MFEKCVFARAIASLVAYKYISVIYIIYTSDNIRRLTCDVFIEKYHPSFNNDLAFLASRLSPRDFQIFLVQLDYIIEQILTNPTKAARLKYPPLENFRKRKFFSSPKPKNCERPDMRIIYQYDMEDYSFRFLCVGLRIPQKPYHQYDIYQQAKYRDLVIWN